MRTLRLCAAVGLLGTGAIASHQDVPTPSPVSELPLRLESWYKVLYKGEHIGHTHVQIVHVQEGKVRYDASTEAEYEFQKGDLLLPVSVKSQVRLSESFESLLLHSTMVLLGQEFSISLKEISEGRSLEILLPSGVRRTFALREDTLIYFDLDLAIFDLHRRGLLKGPGEQSVILFAPRADTVSTTAEVTLSVKEEEMRDYLGKKSTVTRIGVRDSSAYAAELARTTLWVDRYGRIVETEMAGGGRLLLASGEEEARGTRGLISVGARRDPFDKDRVMSKTGVKRSSSPTARSAAAGGPSELIVTPEEAQEVLQEAGEIVADMKRLKKDKQEEEVEKAYNRFLKLYVGLRKVLTADADKTQLEQYKKTADQMVPVTRNLLQQVRKKVELVREYLERTNCEEIEREYNEITLILERPELMDTEERSEIRRLHQEAEAHLARCRARIELANKRLIVSGTVIQLETVTDRLDLAVRMLGAELGFSEDLKVLRSHSYAIINDDIYREGDTIRGENIVLKEILTHGVTVSYRGEERNVGLRR